MEPGIASSIRTSASRGRSGRNTTLNTESARKQPGERVSFQTGQKCISRITRARMVKYETVTGGAGIVRNEN